MTVEQASRANGWLIEAAEQWIDAYTGRSWLDGGTLGAITAERYQIENGRVWLKRRPITAVSAVRYGGLFATAVLLTVTTDYVVDATRGLVTLKAYVRGEVSVDYTAPQTVPTDIAEAAGQIVAGWLTAIPAQVGGSAAGTFKSVRIDDEELVYRDLATMPAVPTTIEHILARWHRPALV